MNFCLLNTLLVAQNKIIIQFRNGTENALLLDQLQKITFNAGMLEMKNKSEIIQSIKIEEIQKIRFGTNSSISLPESDRILQIFPNPVTEYFTVKNAPAENSTAIIYSIDGRKIKEIIVNSAAQNINVTELQPGIYLLRIDKFTFKFSKL